MTRPKNCLAAHSQRPRSKPANRPKTSVEAGCAYYSNLIPDFNPGNRFRYKSLRFKAFLNAAKKEKRGVRSADDCSAATNKPRFEVKSSVLSRVSISFVNFRWSPSERRSSSATLPASVSESMSGLHYAIPRRWNSDRYLRESSALDGTSRCADR